MMKYYNNESKTKQNRSTIWSKSTLCSFEEEEKTVVE